MKKLFLIAVCALLPAFTCGSMPQSKQPAQEKAATSSEKAQVVPQNFEAVISFAPNQTESLEAAIATALKNNPELKVAEAELTLAQAKLNQVRMQISQKVAAQYAQMATNRAEIIRLDDNVKHNSALYKKGLLPDSKLAESKHILEAAKTQTQSLEKGWATLLGRNVTAEYFNHLEFVKVRKNCSDCHHPISDEQKKRFQTCPAAAHGQFMNLIQRAEVDLINQKSQPAPMSGHIEQLASGLGKQLKWKGVTDAPLNVIFKELFSTAGVNVVVRLPYSEREEIMKTTLRLTLDAGEMPLHSWLELILDMANDAQTLRPESRKLLPGRLQLYIREHGLLFTSSELAPPDAQTVSSFWKQSQLTQQRKEQERQKPNTPAKE